MKKIDETWGGRRFGYMFHILDVHRTIETRDSIQTCTVLLL